MAQTNTALLEQSRPPTVLSGYFHRISVAPMTQSRQTFMLLRLLNIELEYQIPAGKGQEAPSPGITVLALNTPRTLHQTPHKTQWLYPHPFFYPHGTNQVNMNVADATKNCLGALIKGCRGKGPMSHLVTMPVLPQTPELFTKLHHP